MKGNERRWRAGRNRTEGWREEGREEGRKGPVKSVKPTARKVAYSAPADASFLIQWKIQKIISFREGDIGRAATAKE